MKKHFLIFSLLLMISILIVPSVSLAAWWNPFTWKIFNKAPKTNVERTIVTTSTPQNILPTQEATKSNEKKRSQSKTNDQSSEVEKIKIEAEQKTQAALKRAQEEIAIMKLKEELDKQQVERTETTRGLYLGWINTLLTESNTVKNAWLGLKSNAENNLTSIVGISGEPTIIVTRLLQKVVSSVDEIISSENEKIKAIEDVKALVLKAVNFSNNYEKYEEAFRVFAKYITASAGRYDQVVKEYNSTLSFIINSSNSYNNLPANIDSYHIPRQTVKTCLFSISGSIIKDYHSGSVECFPF